MKKLVAICAVVGMVLAMSSPVFATVIGPASMKSGVSLIDGQGTEWSAKIGNASSIGTDLGSVANWTVSYTGLVDVTGTAYSTKTSPVWQYQSSIDRINWTSFGSLFNYTVLDTIASTTGFGDAVVNARYFRILGNIGAYTDYSEADPPVFTGATVDTSTTLTVVPEPMTLALLGLGGLLLRKKK